MTPPKGAVFSLLLLCVSNNLQAETTKTFELSTNTGLASIVKAREALKQGAVVFSRFVKPNDLSSALGVRRLEHSGPSRRSATAESTSCLVAVHLVNGTVHSFVGPPVKDGHRPERERCATAFEQWRKRQDLVRTTPDSTTWTQQGSSSRLFGEFSTDVNIYRAVSDDANWAYYMYVLEMADQTASPAVKTCTMNLQGLELQNQLAPTVFDYGRISASPGTPQLVGTFIPSSQPVTPYQPDGWSGNESTIAYTGTSQAATWLQQYNGGEDSAEERVAVAIFEVPRSSPLSVDIITSCTDGATPSSQSDVTYAITPPDLVVPSNVYVVAGSSLQYRVGITPLGPPSFGWTPAASSSAINLTQDDNNITVSAPLSSLGTVVGVSYNIDPSGSTTTLVPSTQVHIVATPPPSGVLLAGGYNGKGELLATADVWDANTGTVTPTTNSMTTTRSRHTATLIDATHILIAGGFGGPAAAAQSSTEIYDITTGLFTAGPNMNSARAGHTATLLTGAVDGMKYVVLAGGVDENRNPVGTLEVYNVSTGAFLPSPAMVTARWNHTATTSDNQNIIIAGGSQSTDPSVPPLSSVEICGINAEDVISCQPSYENSGLTTGRQGHAAAVATNGDSYVFGGFTSSGNDPLGCSNPLCTFELSEDNNYGDFGYTYFFQSFTSYLPSKVGRRYPAVTALPSSTIDPTFLLVGGDNTAQQLQWCIFSIGCQIESSLPQYGAVATLTSPRAYPIAIYLDTAGTPFDNQVLIAGGVDLSVAAPSDPGTLIELYDPTHNKVSLSGQMSSPRTFLTATLFQAPPQQVSSGHNRDH